MKNKNIDIKKIRKDVQRINILVIDGNVIIASNDIAEITGKRHNNVLKDIREEEEGLKNIDVTLLRDKFGRKLFEESAYTDKKGRLQPNFLVTKFGIIQIMGRYNSCVGRLLIERIEEIENTIKRKNK